MYSQTDDTGTIDTDKVVDIIASKHTDIEKDKIVSATTVCSERSECQYLHSNLLTIQYVHVLGEKNRTLTLDNLTTILVRIHRRNRCVR